MFRRSIHKFAFDNNFEVHDVKPDGNCMFRALADQLLINGFPGHTEMTLRKDAIKYVFSILYLKKYLEIFYYMFVHLAKFALKRFVYHQRFIILPINVQRFMFSVDNA